MSRLVFIFVEAAAVLLIIWGGRASRRPVATQSAGYARISLTVLSLGMLAVAAVLFAAVAVSSSSSPAREVDEPVMTTLFFGLAATLAGGFLAASSVDAVRDTMWLTTLPLLPAFVMLLPLAIQPQEYGRLLQLPVLALIFIAFWLLAWSSYRWWRGASPKVSARTRSWMTRLSVAALAISVALVTVVLAHPAAFSGLGDEDLPKIFVFFVGLLAAVMGGFMSASAAGKARDRLWPAGLLLLVLWAVLLNELEPGSW